MYGNLSEKKALFLQFERARDVLIGFLLEGITIAEVIRKRMLVQCAL